jgi:hypothetical protein
MRDEGDRFLLFFTNQLPGLLSIPGVIFERHSDLGVSNRVAHPGFVQPAKSTQTISPPQLPELPCIP